MFVLLRDYFLWLLTKDLVIFVSVSHKDFVDIYWFKFHKIPVTNIQKLVSYEISPNILNKRSKIFAKQNPEDSRRLVTYEFSSRDIS